MKQFPQSVIDALYNETVAIIEADHPGRVEYTAIVGSYIADVMARGWPFTNGEIPEQRAFPGGSINKAIAELLGYTVYHYDKGTRDYYMLVDGEEFNPVMPGREGERASEEVAWADAHNFAEGECWEDIWSAIEKGGRSKEDLVPYLYAALSDGGTVSISTVVFADWMFKAIAAYNMLFDIKANPPIAEGDTVEAREFISNCGGVPRMNAAQKGHVEKIRNGKALVDLGDEGYAVWVELSKLKKVE